MADQLHNYCRKALAGNMGKENRCPSYLVLGDHMYIKPPQKRPRGSPTGHTPYSLSKRHGRQLEELLLEESTCTTKPTNRKGWQAEETAALHEYAGRARVHSQQFWEDCAKMMNERFSSSRTGVSCRLRYTRALKAQLTLGESTDHDDCTVLKDRTCDASTQTEPVIPVCQQLQNQSVQINIEKPCLTLTAKKGEKSTDVSAAAHMLHRMASTTDGNHTDSTLPDETVLKLLSLLLNSYSVPLIIDCIFSDTILREELWSRFLAELRESARCMCERRRSYLYHKGFESLKNFDWMDIIKELTVDHPLLTQVLLAYTLPHRKLGNGNHLETLVPVLGLVYGSLMKARWKDLAKVQRVVSLIMAEEKVHQKICCYCLDFLSCRDVKTLKGIFVKVYDRLQPLGICVSHMVTSSVMDEISGHFQDQLIDAVKHNKRFRLVGDNVNFAVDVSHLRKTSDKHKQLEHWFGSAAIIQEVSFDHLSSTSPQRDLISMSCDDFLPQNDDWNGLREDYTVLIMRVLMTHLPAFKTFKACVPTVITGLENEKLKIKNKVIPLPVLPKNEQRYDDVIDVLDHYESVVREVHDKAGQPLDDSTRVHIGGDQLTRERFSGAKRLRGVGDAGDNKFLHLSPITFEFFHLLMTILSMLYKILYSEKSTETGTLGAEKVRLGRKRADGNDVKCHFNDCSELAVSVVDAYIVEAACHFFGMDTVDDQPSQHLDQPLELMSTEEKTTWMKTAVGELVDTMVWHHTRKHLQDDLPQGTYHQVTVVMPDGTRQILMFPIAASTPTISTLQSEDGCECYAQNMLELGLLYKDLSDVIKVPERSRTIRILKYAMVMLKGHNHRSKYALEILRFLCHQQATLSERTAFESFYGLFVNTAGKVGSHIAADMQMEHIVKVTKGHIRSFQSNKSERAIVKRTAAISGMKTVAENFDMKTKVITRAQKHTVPSSVDDEKILIHNLRRLKPFKMQAGRVLLSIPKLARSPVCKVKKQYLKTWIREHQLNLNCEIGQ